MRQPFKQKGLDYLKKFTDTDSTCIVSVANTVLMNTLHLFKKMALLKVIVVFSTLLIGVEGGETPAGVAYQGRPRGKRVPAAEINSQI
jgi:hypothetical protein